MNQPIGPSPVTRDTLAATQCTKSEILYGAYVYPYTHALWQARYETFLPHATQYLRKQLACEPTCDLGWVEEAELLYDAHQLASAMTEDTFRPEWDRLEYPLCTDCRNTHDSEKISCEEVAEFIDADRSIFPG